MRCLNIQSTALKIKRFLKGYMLILLNTVNPKQIKVLLAHTWMGSQFFLVEVLSFPTENTKRF